MLPLFSPEHGAQIQSAAPWMQLIPGDPPLIFLVNHSRLFSAEPDFFARLERGEAEALSEVRELANTNPLNVVDVEIPTGFTSISLNVAQACNLACGYCYADEGQFGGRVRHMSEQVAFSTIDRLFESTEEKRVLIGFIGGEPFLNREVLHRSVNHAVMRADESGHSVALSVTTNGTLLQPEDIDLLRGHEFTVSISLDGDASTNDRHRPGKEGRGSHAKVLDAVRLLLLDSGRARLVARATVTRDDLRVYERITPLLEAGFHEVGVSPTRTGPDPTLIFREEDWAPFLHEMIHAAEKELARVRSKSPNRRIRFSNLSTALTEIHRGTCRPLPCGAAVGYASVNAEGEYFTCHRTVDDPRFSLSEPEARRRFISERMVDRQEPCRNCWARYLCGGGCHAEVIQAGREGCDYIRGWLEYCLRTYNQILENDPALIQPPLQRDFI